MASFTANEKEEEKQLKNFHIPEAYLPTTGYGEVILIIKNNILVFIFSLFEFLFTKKPFKVRIPCRINVLCIELFLKVVKHMSSININIPHLPPLTTRLFLYVRTMLSKSMLRNRDYPEHLHLHRLKSAVPQFLYVRYWQLSLKLLFHYLF